MEGKNIKTTVSVSKHLATKVKLTSLAVFWCGVLAPSCGAIRYRQFVSTCNGPSWPLDGSQDEDYILYS